MKVDFIQALNLIRVNPRKSMPRKVSFSAILARSGVRRLYRQLTTGY